MKEEKTMFFFTRRIFNKPP